MQKGDFALSTGGIILIEIKEVNKCFGNIEVLKDINMQLENGKIYGVIGQSGSGKSTLLRCLNGLSTYDKGSIKVDGIEVSDLKGKEARKFRQNIGMIFQHYSLLSRLNVYENIALPMKCWNYKKFEIDVRVNELLDMVQIPDKKFAYPSELSGGQKQRVAIARALAMNPKIMLCDEATSALDPNIADTIMELLAEINKKLGITIILVTHQLEIVKAYCDKVYILENGIIAAEGECQKLFNNPPEALRNLMGIQSNYSLPEGGKNIRIILQDKGEDAKLLTQMALETNGAFSVVKAESEQYCNNRIFYAIIHVEDNEFEKTCKWLEGEKIDWIYEKEVL